MSRLECRGEFERRPQHKQKKCIEDFPVLPVSVLRDPHELSMIWSTLSYEKGSFGYLRLGIIHRIRLRSPKMLTCLFYALISKLNE